MVLTQAILFFSAELGTYISPNVFTGTLDLPSGWLSATTASVTFSGTTANAALDAGSLSNDATTWGDWIPATNGVPVITSWNLGSDGANKRVYLRLRDVNARAAQVVTGTVNVDTTPPSSLMADLPLVSSSQIHLNWYGFDNLSGVASYDLQVRIGASGSWTPLLTGTTATSATFVGVPPNTYFFRVRAIDIAGNIETYPLTYDTFTTVIGWGVISSNHSEIAVSRNKTPAMLRASSGNFQSPHARLRYIVRQAIRVNRNANGF